MKKLKYLATLSLSFFPLIFGINPVQAEDYQLVSYSLDGTKLAYLDYDSIVNINNFKRATILWKIIESNEESEVSVLLEFNCLQNQWRLLDIPNAEWQTPLNEQSMDYYIQEAVCQQTENISNNLSN